MPLARLDVASKRFYVAVVLTGCHTDNVFGRKSVHATDEAYYDKVWYWSTPQEDCADTDAATTCKTQDDWVAAWTALRGS